MLYQQHIVNLFLLAKKKDLLITKISFDTHTS